MDQPSKKKWTLLLPAAMLLASELLYLSLLRLNAINGARPVLIFLATIGAAFALCFAAYLLLQKRRWGAAEWALIIGGAMLFRITLLPAGLPPDLTLREKFAAMSADWRGESVTYERFQLFDDDIWRYLWDAHVASAGINVYAAAPADSALDSLVSAAANAHPDWETIRANINYADLRTIYPPLAQIVFRSAHWLAPGSVLAMKTIVAAFDLLAFAFLILTLAALDQPPARSILYGWNPLVIKVFAGSGHIDAVLVAALSATCYFLVRKRRTAASASLGLAIAAKIIPIVLLPFLLRRAGKWRTVLACMVALVWWLPYFGAGTRAFDSLLAFSEGWQFNGGIFQLLASVLAVFTSRPQLPARMICGAAIAMLLLVLYRSDDRAPATFADFTVVTLGSILIFSPAVMPWYVTWLLPAAIIARNRAAIFFSLAVCASFFVMVQGVEWPWALVLEYGALGGVICWEILHNGFRLTRSEHQR
jgi:alpha-1,6-mannosyltransferase